MKKLISLLFIFTTFSLSAQTLTDQIVLARIIPSDSKSYAIGKIISLGFKNTQTWDQDFVNSYTNDQSTLKNNTVILHTNWEKKVVKIEWKLSFDYDYTGEESKIAYNLLKSELDAIWANSKSFNLIKLQAFYFLQNKEGEIMTCQIVDNYKANGGVGSVSVIFMKDDEAEQLIASIIKEEYFKVAFMPVLEKMEKEEKQREKENGYNTDYANCSDGRYIIGDVNNDGKDDCIISWNCSQGTLASSYGGQAVLIDNNEYKPEIYFTNAHAYGHEYGQAGNYTTIDKIENGIIFATGHYYKEEDPRCCPSIEVPVKYKFVNGKLMEITR